MEKKRIIYIILFIILCIVLGFAIYWVFFAKKAPKIISPGVTPIEDAEFPTSGLGEPKTPEDITEPTGLPTAIIPTTDVSEQQEERPRVKQIIKSSITNPSLDFAGKTNFYNNQDGKFYRVAQNGETELLSDQIFYNVEKVNWSPTKNETIIEYPDGSNIFYNFETKEQTTLPKHWEEFSFSSQGDKIAAKSMALSPENRWVITSEPNGNEITLIEPMGNNANQVIVDWSPNGQVVGLATTGAPLGADRQEVLFVGLNGENFKSITVEGRGLRTQWSTGGEKLLYSVYSARSEFKPELWITNAEGADIGTGRKMLSVNTWADKCTFQDERFVYCAVPNNLREGVSFAPEIALYAPDTIYRIDTQNGIKTELYTEELHAINNIYIDENNNTLYYTDNLKPGLFSVPL
jgi:sugar lactone lactonase YvrE